MYGKYCTDAHWSRRSWRGTNIYTCINIYIYIYIYIYILVTHAGGSSHYVESSFVLSHHQPCSSSSVSVLPVSLSVVLSGISAISLLSGGASSALLTPAGDSSRYVSSFVLFHPQLCSFSAVSALSVSVFLVLSSNSAISLLSGGALSALVTPAGGSHHVATCTVPLSIFVLHLVLNYCY